MQHQMQYAANLTYDCSLVQSLYQWIQSKFVEKQKQILGNYPCLATKSKQTVQLAEMIDTAFKNNHVTTWNEKEPKIWSPGSVWDFY